MTQIIPILINLFSQISFADTMTNGFECEIRNERNMCKSIKWNLMENKKLEIFSEIKYIDFLPFLYIYNIIVFMLFILVEIIFHNIYMV